MDIRKRRTSRLALVALASATTVLASCSGDPTTPPDGPAPTISAVDPSTGTVGTDLRITGTDFRTGASATIGTLAASQVDVASATEIFARVPAGVAAGTTYDVKVTNSDGTSVTHVQAFTAVAPTLSFVNGATKPSGNIGSTVILEGSAFGDAQGPGNVLFSNGTGGTVAATIAAAADWTDGFILTTVPSGAATGPVLVATGTGQSASLPFTITSNATFSPSTIAWTQTQSLPVGVSGHSATYVPIDNNGVPTERVYVVGGTGNDSIPKTSIYYSVIQANGSVGTWSTGTALTTGIAHHAAVVATPFNSKVKGSGFLYVLGGIEAKGGQPISTIQRVPLNSDGTTGAPTVAGTLPAPGHSLGAVVFRSTIYLVGGATTSNTAMNTVYRAAIDTLGTIGAWETLTALPTARAHHQLVVFGGFLYAVGGDTGAVDVNDANFTQNNTKLSTVAVGRIDLRTGLLPSGWSEAGSSMSKARSKHVALAAGGSLFVSSGLYAAAGTGSSENSYATINSDGTLGSFAGATGSNTLFSIGGINLFNTRGVSYIDGSGVAHVMILGGDDVGTPGAKSNKVLYY